MRIIRTIAAGLGVLTLAAGCTAPSTEVTIEEATGRTVVLPAPDEGSATPESFESDDPTHPDAPVPVAGSEAIFVGEGSGTENSWQTYVLDVPKRSLVTVTLNWNSVPGDSNLQVYLKKLDGSSDYARANSATAKPEVASATVDAGKYMIAVKIKEGTGKTGYTVSVDLRPETTESTPVVTVPPTTTTRPPTTTTTTAKPATVPTTTIPRAPVTPPVTAPNVSGPKVGTPKFPGDVAPGYVRWGAAVGGNSDPVARHESIAGRTMGLRRTYFSWDRRLTSMVSTAKADLQAERVPWVSVKTPGWSRMASGALDGEIDSMLRALDALGGPVWLTVHHEPEGGGGSVGPDDPGGAPAWRNMQKRIRQRMTAVGTRNIAFAPILMSWTFSPLSGRNVSDWWVDGVWDFAGIDHYYEREQGAITDSSDSLWQNTMAFYTSKGLKIALGEWGNRGTDASAATEMRNIYTMALNSANTPRSQVIGFAYFDSNLNSPTGGWEIQGAPLTEFRRLIALPTSLKASQTGY